MSEVDFLRTGIYTVAEAASLIGVTPQKVRGWISGWPGSKAAPVVENEIGWIDRKLAFSFANLMELRFIAFFENAGVKLQAIRAIIHEANLELKRPHPFATNIVFKTDGYKIVAEIAHKNGIHNLYDLKSRNFEMATIVYKSLKEGVVYDPRGNAQAWFPNKIIAPNVMIHPRLAFGRPVLKNNGIPTGAIEKTVKAEGSVEKAAILFEIPTKRAQEAVAFEEYLRRAA